MQYVPAGPHGRIDEESRYLVKVARGDAPADAVITNGTLVNVHTGELQSNVDLAVAHGRIVRVFGHGEDSSSLVGSDTRKIDAEGMYLAPGFLDSHVHIESSMSTVRGFTQGVLPRGTTGVFMDPHEIGNVLGLDGIRWMMEEAEEVPLKVWCTTPSCVPAAPGFEDTGAELTPEDIEETMDWPWVIGLGEMMNFPGVVHGDEEVHEKLGVTYRANRVVTGHFSIPDTGADLQAFVASGISSCHESVRREDALAKLRLGMWTMLRHGSAWQDVPETIKAVTENNIDTRHLLLVSDDCHPETILDEGHLDRVGRAAIENGLNPIEAIQALTINPAEYFGVSADVGSLSPGKIADVLFIEDLADLSVRHVMMNGEMLVEESELNLDSPQLESLYQDTDEYVRAVENLYPTEARETIHMTEAPSPDDFTIGAPADTEEVEVEVMQIIEARVGTERIQKTLQVSDGELKADSEQDVAKVFCFDRHRPEGDAGHGFVSGFGFDRGAVASTVAHDSHNLLVVGMDDESMATATERMIEINGGMVAADGDDVLADVPLPVAGLMSDKPIDDVADEVRELYSAWRELGCDLESPFMTMALLALPVLPEIRVSNRGLIDTVEFEFINPVAIS